MLKKTTLLVFMCVVFVSAFTQDIGEWRMHINYNNSISAASSSSKVIVANKKSVLFYNFNDGGVRTLDKVTGLSDYGVNDVAYDEETNTFLVAYVNSNIDLINENTVINLPDIKNKLIAGSKTINDIYCFKGFAYVSTDFGIVVIDIENEEVENTYVIGSTGNQTKVFDCSINHDTIYALTSEGLKSAYLLSGNLLDYSVWNHNLFSSLNFNEIETYKDTLYAISDSNFYQYRNSTWFSIFGTDSNELSNLYSSDILSFIDNKINVVIYENSKIDTLATPYSVAPSACFKLNNNLILSDYSLGVFSNENKVFNFTSPFSNDGFRALSVNNKIIITSGGFNRNLDGDLKIIEGFYVFDGNWTNHNIYSTIGTEEESEDLNYLAYNSFNNKVYIAMLKGLIEFDFNTVKIYNKTNSPIDSFIGNPNKQVVSGVDVDSKGNVWILNPGTDKLLKVLDLEGNWHEFFVGDDNEKHYNLFIDSHDQKWIASKSNALRVYKEGENMSAIGAQNIILSTSQSQGNLPNNNVYSIAEDKDGQIWVGTEEGIAIFNCPEGIFDASTGCRESSRITSTLDLYTEYLFETDKVSAIEIDGANRKWVGTSSGAWLLSEDGKEVIHNFNLENSPLPSNEIFDIEINKSTGEVFFLTSEGFVSYVSDATEGASDNSNIKAYPNPVRPDYTGFISITGLVQDAFVKITDEHGVLVDEGYALGGKYVWDGNDYNGKRVNSGVYYIFSANNDASEKAVTKIAFVK